MAELASLKLTLLYVYKILFVLVDFDSAQFFHVIGYNYRVMLIQINVEYMLTVSLLIGYMECIGCSSNRF